jgi:hypothetical protein
MNFISNLNTINIKYLCKIDIIYELWKNALVSEFAEYGPDIEEPCKEIIELDIHNMFISGRMYFTLYYGKLLFIDITDNTCDVTYYNSYNGKHLGQKILADLKIKEMESTIFKYQISK